MRNQDNIYNVQTDIFVSVHLTNFQFDASNTFYTMSQTKWYWGLYNNFMAWTSFFLGLI